MPGNTTNNTTPSAQTDRQGLEFAERCFGPLLHPITATQNAWTSYSINRLKTNEEKGNVLSGSGKDHTYYEDDMVWLPNSVKARVSEIEKEMNLDMGTLQKCTTILWDVTELDEVDPRSADHLVRIYSPTTPMYIDVHFRYYCRPRMSEIEWFYTLGYKIQRCPPAEVADISSIEKELVEGGPPVVHTRNGWQTLCWGYYDDSNGNYGRNWRRIELGKVEVTEERAANVYETLFGELEKPAAADPEAILAYQRSLIRGIRLLLAAAGISYEIACTGDEMDIEPRDFMLEGCLTDGSRGGYAMDVASDLTEMQKKQRKVLGYNKNRQGVMGTLKTTKKRRRGTSNGTKRRRRSHSKP